MKTEKDQNMLFGATGVAIVVLVVVLFQAKKYTFLLQNINVSNQE